MIQNLEEFKALILRYDKLKLRDIKNANNALSHTIFRPAAVARKLTGFGSEYTCTLCRPLYVRLDIECHKCVYSVNVERPHANFHCTKGPNSESYHAIFEAENEEDLLKCYEIRKKHMLDILTRYKKQVLNQ